MILDDIKADETNENTSVEQWIDNLGEIRCLKPAFKQNANDDEKITYLHNYEFVKVTGKSLNHCEYCIKFNLHIIE